MTPSGCLSVRSSRPLLNSRRSLGSLVICLLLGAAWIKAPVEASAAPGTPRPAATAGALANKVDVYAFASHWQPSATVASLPAVVDGVSWIFRWKDIETAPNVYNWSTVDAAISAAADSGRKSMLRIDGGAYSPSWVPNQLTFSFKPQGPRPYQTVTMPRTWDSTYIADWKAFIRAYGARYDGDMRVARIQMAGGGWLGEMALPQWAGWVGAGYTDAAMTSAWKQFIDAYRSAFPHHPSALDFGEPLSTYYHAAITPTVLAYAATYGPLVSIQENGLKSVTSETGKVFQTILSASATTAVGWEMWGGNTSSSDLMLAFKTALDSHASYVEVYLSDCVNPANLAALSYLAHGG